MLALYIILGIFALITLLLSINFVLVVDYDSVLKVHAKWLFLKFPIFPKKEKPKAKDDKKSKKEKQEKTIEETKEEVKEDEIKDLALETEDSKNLAEKPQESLDEALANEKDDEKADTETKKEIEKGKESKKDEAKDKTKPKKLKSPLLILYEKAGFDGIIGLLHHTVDALGGLFKGLYRHLVIREIYVDFLVTGKDAADTAIKYGSLCQKVFPAFGFICSNMKVLKYDIEINPDFLGGKSEARYYLVLSMKPLFLLWYLLAAVIKLGFNVVLKVFLLIKPKKRSKSKKAKNKIKA